MIYPAGLLGELVCGGHIVPVPSYVRGDSSWNEADVFELLRVQETRWGQQVWAVPLGSPQLVLYYRADLLRQVGREPPVTWSELEELAGLLGGRQSDGSAVSSPPALPRYAAVQPLAPGWAGRVLLARAAGYARHRGYYSALFDYQTMEPRIGQAPFVRALEELVRCAVAGPPEALDLSPGGARRLFFQGQCALALAWPHARDEQTQDQPTDMGYAELPGSRGVQLSRPALGDTWGRRTGANSFAGHGGPAGVRHAPITTQASGVSTISFAERTPVEC